MSDPVPGEPDLIFRMELPPVSPRHRAAATSAISPSLLPLITTPHTAPDRKVSATPGRPMYPYSTNCVSQAVAQKWLFSMSHPQAAAGSLVQGPRLVPS